MKAEHELSEFEKHYRMLFNAIDEGFCIIEVIFDENENPIDYRFIETNLSFEKQTGLIDAQGKRMRQLAPKHEEHWFEIYGKIAVTGQPVRFVNRAEQLQRWYDVYAFRFGQPENRQVAILFNDITARQQAEVALRESEERYRSLFDNMLNGLAYCKMLFEQNQPQDFIYLDVNCAFETLTGLKNVVGKRVSEVIPEIRESCPEIFEVYGRVALTGNPERFEIYLKPLNIWLLISVYSPEKEYFVAVFEAISDRKKAVAALRASEGKFRTLYDNAPLGYQSLDEDGVIIEVNQTWLDTLGYCREEVIGKWSGDFQTPHSAESFPQRFARFKEDGKIRDVVVEMVSRDGTIIIASFNGTIAYDDQGKVTRTHCMFQDITERKRAEEVLAKNHSELQNTAQQLEQSKNMLQLIIESIPVRVFWKDRDSRFMGCNTLFARDAGLSRPEQLLGKDDFAMGWGEQAEAYRADDLQVMESRRPKLNIIEAQTTPTGAKIWLNTSKVPLQMPNGEVFGVLGVYEDVTARYQAESALKKERDQAQQYLDIAAVMIIILDSQGRITLINKKGCEILGYREEDCLNLDWFDVFIPEKTRDCLKAKFADMLAGRIEPWENMENPVLPKRGEERLIAWHNTVLKDDSGAIIAVLSSGEDITERKRAEESFQSLVSSAPMGIYIVQDGKFAMVSPGFEVITGYHAQELIGQHCLNPVSPEFRAFVREQALLRLKGEVLSPYEYQFITKNGETGWVMEKVIPTQYKGKQAVMGYFMDISSRIEMEEQFLRAQKMEAVGTLAGGIAHDFNNILTAILGNIGLAALDDKIGPRGKDRLAQAEAACLRAEALSRQLLTFAKGGAPVKKLFSVPELLTETTVFACVGSPVKCETTFPENLWWMEADPGQIGQVFQNLTINAIQAMPTGGTIKVWAENLTLETESGLPLSAGKYIKISVRDQGIGISAEHLPRIFDPYFTTKHKGSGLGLASAYAIVNKHNGHIAVESKPGVGTTFHIYLPAVEQQATPQPKRDRELLVGTGKILVMDDEDMVREVLGRLLARLGYEAEFAKDGGEAIEMFTQAQGSGQAFAAVILDLTVPGGMGGKETMAGLLEIDPQVKAIVSSGYSDDPIMADFQKYGFSGVIAKPYRISELGMILNQVIMKKA
jgi:PAS domain S-box-containing protein